MDIDQKKKKNPTLWVVHNENNITPQISKSFVRLQI